MIYAAEFKFPDLNVVLSEVRLVGGSHSSGRLEILHDQTWGLQEIQCRGNESQIHLCPTSPSHENNCSHESHVGLVCAGLIIFSNKLKSNLMSPNCEINIVLFVTVFLFFVWYFFPRHFYTLPIFFLICPYLLYRHYESEVSRWSQSLCW